MRFDEWSAQHPAIDEEHERLHSIIRSLAAVANHSSDTVLVRESLALLTQRMRLHFQAEEREAERVDPEILAILQEDHAALLVRIERVRSVIHGPRPVVCKEVAELIDALDKHDREVDVPLFRLIAQRNGLSQRN